MTFKLASLTLLACAVAANAQTTHHTASSTHHAASTSEKTSPNIPKVPGMPKALYSLKYIDISIGTGPLAEERKYYTVRYTGWLTDGTKFDSSNDHPGAEPITFPYGAHRVITGWDTGFQGMHVGGKRHLFVPYQLAYGETGRLPVIPARADLIFDIELVEQSDTPPQPAAPPATAPNPDANSTGATPDTTARPSTNTTPSPTPTKPNTPPHPEKL